MSSEEEEDSSQTLEEGQLLVILKLVWLKFAIFDYVSPAQPVYLTWWLLQCFCLLGGTLGKKLNLQPSFFAPAGA